MEASAGAATTPASDRLARAGRSAQERGARAPALHGEAEGASFHLHKAARFLGSAVWWHRPGFRPTTPMPSITPGFAASPSLAGFSM